MDDLSMYHAKLGTLDPVWTLEIQTLHADVDRILDAVMYVHQYEEPVIYVRADWVSRANYNAKSDNPNRWWNNGRGLPKQV